MAEGGLADKGFWALIVLGITTLLAFLRRPQETRRTRRRAQEAVQVASQAKHDAAGARQQQQEAQAHADHTAQQAKIDGLDDAGILANAAARLDRERADGRPSPGLFNGPAAGRRRAH